MLSYYCHARYNFEEIFQHFEKSIKEINYKSVQFCSIITFYSVFIRRKYYFVSDFKKYMTNLKKGDKVMFDLPNAGGQQIGEVTDVLEKCVQVKYNSASYSNLMTLDKDRILEKLPETLGSK